METEVRRLTAEDAEIFRSIRLESLQCHPEAFAGSYEVESGLAVEDIAGRLAKGTVFGAFRDGELVAMAGFSPLKSPKARHKGILWGVYVREGARGTGVGRTLVAKVLDHAGSQVELVHLSVVTSNPRALKFFKDIGFESYGVERHALKIGGAYFDEEMLVYRLD